MRARGRGLHGGERGQRGVLGVLRAQPRGSQTPRCPRFVEHEMLSWRSHPGAQRVPAPHPCCGCGALCVPTAARPPPIRAQLGLGCPQHCWPQPCTARVLPQSWLAGRKCSLVVLGWLLQQRVAMGRPSGSPMWFRCAPKIQMCKGRAMIQAPWLWKWSGVFRGSSLVPGHLSCSLSGSPHTWDPWVLGGLRVLLPQEEIPKGPSPSAVSEQLGLLTPEDAVVL